MSTFSAVSLLRLALTITARGAEYAFTHNTRRDMHKYLLVSFANSGKHDSLISK